MTEKLFYFECRNDKSWGGFALFPNVEKFTVRVIAIGHGRSIERPYSYVPVVQGQLDNFELRALTG